MNARQLTLQLWPGAAMGAGDYFVSGSNRAAHDVVTGGDWPGGRLALTGAPGAGKTHLAQIWAQAARAPVIAAAGLRDLALPAPGAALVVEDLDTLPQDAEEALFHLINHLAATSGRLLVTAPRPPARLSIALPDLASRLQAFSLARIDSPDDALLAAILAKLFADRGLAPDSALIPWLVARMERSFAAASELAELLDAMALSEGRALTVPFARAVLSQAGLFRPDGD